MERVWKPAVMMTLWCLLGISGTGAETPAGLEAVALRCEYLDNPSAIDETSPRLSWQVTSDQRGQRQTAYRILVASSSQALEADRGDLWDTGKVVSNRTTLVPYEGAPLRSRQRCFWKVQVWDRAGAASAWSQPASWSMGLLDDSDWSAEYITYRDETPIFKDRESLFLPPARQYRKQFAAGKPVRRATIYATALGVYELHLNGQRVGDTYFAPGWTDYRQRAYYQTYDVTSMLEEGPNVLGAWVADGWYSGYVGFGLLTGMGTERIGRYTYGKTPSVMAQLEIEYQDGTRATVITDGTWKVSGDGPIREADLLMGESYDARKEQPGWASVDFDDSDWDAAILAADNGRPSATFYEAKNPQQSGRGPKIEGQLRDLGFQRPRLEAFPGVPARVIEEIKPVKLTRRGEGTYIFNLGQNFAGTIRMHVRGPAGQRIRLRYGEMLHPDGRLMTENLRKARATDFYVCAGDAEGETYQPRFTFHGFQYVEVADFPGEPDLDTITGLVIHSDTPLVSTFACSDPMVNQLYRNVVWTQRANFLDLPTDCPQRDERMGWTGDAQAYVATAAYNADIGAFYTKWLRELMESQRPSGAFPGYAPFPFQHGWDFGTAWADAGVICPWTIWQVYGDTRVIDRCWEPMTRFMQWRKATSVNDLGIVHGNNWGDWLAQGETTPLDYIDSVYFALTTRMMAEMAEATGRDSEARRYRVQRARTQAAFVDKYLEADGELGVPTQTAYALALFADLVPERTRAQAGRRLAERLALNGNRMSTGFLGTRPLLPVLSSAGQHDLAVFLLQSREFPSWGYEIEQGATTIWERWDSYTKEDGFGRHNAAMNSFSHYSFGAVCEWMFRTLAGIGSAGPGYQNIVIAPRPPAPGSNAQHPPIHWVKASYDSIRGKIVSDWKVDGNRFLLTATIPANTTARVLVPGPNAEQVCADGRPLDEVPHVRVLEVREDGVLLQVESGTYRFESTGGIRPAAEAYRTSQPADLSRNPDGIDLDGARALLRWDFGKPEDVAGWTASNNLRIESRDGAVYLVATGSDPQMVTELAKPLRGQLAVRLRAHPVKPSLAQFFWDAPNGGFHPGRQTGRSLNASQETGDYLFRIDAEQPLRKLRFDPFAEQAEMKIESITIYRLDDA